MSEETNNTNNSDSNNSRPQSEFVNELNKLGENLGQLMRSVWESEERKSIEREMTNGIEQLAKQLNQTLDQLKTDATVGNAKKTVKEAWETARGPKIVSEVHQGVVDTLKKVNEELTKHTQPAHEVKIDDTPTPPSAN